MKQINLKMPEILLKEAKKYVEKFGYKNIQELALDSIREKIFCEEDDEEFTKKEIELIEKIVEKIEKKKAYGTREDLMKELER